MPRFAAREACEGQAEALLGEATQRAAAQEGQLAATQLLEVLAMLEENPGLPKKDSENH